MVNVIRRRLVAGLALAGGAGVTPLGFAAQPEEFPNSAGAERPKNKAPALACDSHVHIYDDAFPVLNKAAAKPVNADVAAYRRIQARLGTTRTVVVQPANYKTDNRVTLAAISALGAKNTRGIAVVTPDVTDEELQHLHDGGIRGVRFSLFQPTGAITNVDMIGALAPRIQALGWHVQLQMRADLIVANARMLSTLACPVVIDHMGRLPHPVIGSEAHRVMLSLLQQGRCWVKVSGAYLNSKQGAPDYADARPIAQSFVDVAPNRIVWGSDWPHPTEHDHKPDDARLFDLVGEWFTDTAVSHRILVENPAELYGFDMPN